MVEGHLGCHDETATMDHPLLLATSARGRSDADGGSSRVIYTQRVDERLPLSTTC